MALVAAVAYMAMDRTTVPTSEPYGTKGHIQAVGIPQQAEKLIMFQDRGRVYTVGMETGQIRYVDASAKP